MSLKIIGAGVGRTGTYSLKLAVNQLGLGPRTTWKKSSSTCRCNCRSGRPLWRTTRTGGDLQGYRPPLMADRWLLSGANSAYPAAKFILTHRSPESWGESFSATIYKLISAPQAAPEAMQPWLAMATTVIARTGFPLGLDKVGLASAFEAHLAAVKETISRLATPRLSSEGRMGTALPLSRRSSTGWSIPAHE